MEGQIAEPPVNASPSTQANSGTMQLFATGLNSHGQLSAGQEGSDLNALTAMTSPNPAENVSLLHAGWSTTALQIGAHVTVLGHDGFTNTIPDEQFFDGFGDHEGMVGCLDAQGRIWSSTGKVECRADPEGSPLIGHIAVAGNEQVAMTFKQAPNGRLCHVLCFADLRETYSWYENPAEVPYDAEKQHTMMQGQPRQLLAGTGTFLLRMESGGVYSWGDPRYSSLGRSIGPNQPAERPALVEALGGLKIKKIACGGWLNAALSEDGACYLWGSCTPGTDKTIKCLRNVRAAGEVVLVELLGEDGGDILDVLDVAVGDNHIVLLAEGHSCYGVGDNRNGQLGLGHTDPFVEDWTLIPTGDLAIRSVSCGPKSTFAFAAGTG